jgi:hypothetical protein
MLSLEDAWIKAAIEHKTLEITYIVEEPSKN